MNRILLKPLGVIGGLVAAMLGRKLFERLWRVIDDEEAPSTKQRQVSWPKLVVALLVEGAIFGTARGMADRASRTAVLKLTGTWPGEERAKPR